MAIEQATLWDKVKDIVLEQYKSSPNLKGLIQSVVEECAQPIDDAAFSIQDFFDVSKATAGWLDILGKYVSLERNPGESDESFRERIVIEVSTNTAGTPDNIIFNSAILAGDPKPQYMDEAPATFFVYDGPVYERHDPETEGGEPYDELVKPAAQRQLLRREVKKLAPCGVLGLPGAAIQMADGCLLCTSDHKKLILAVANDANSEVDTVLIDNGGTLMVTSQQKVVKVTIKGDARYQTTPIHVDGVPGTVDGIRVKDLPDAQNDDAYVLRDSEAGGTTKAGIVGDSGFDSLWENTPADPDDDMNETQGD